MNPREKFEQVTLTIPINTTTSDILFCASGTLVGIITPAALTGTAFSFKVSPKVSSDGAVGDFYDFYNVAGSAVSVTVAASRYIGIVPSDMSGVNCLKIVSNASEAAARTIICVIRDVQ